jgi:hypothetical protein
MKKSEHNKNMQRREQLISEINKLELRLRACRLQDEKDFVQKKIDPLKIELSEIPVPVKSIKQPKKVQPVIIVEESVNEDDINNLKNKSLMRKKIKGES